MTHLALIHGGGDSGSAFDLLAAELRDRGHTTSAVDLPIDVPGAELEDSVTAVVEATGSAEQVVVVAHSWGGFVGPLVVDRLGDRAQGIVLLAAMVPRHGEAPNDWWQNTAHDADLSGDPAEVFYNGVPADVVERALAGGRDHLESTGSQPWPLQRWPEVPTHVLLFADDRVFPLAWMRDVVRDRLGVEADVMPGGHVAYLADPVGVADRLESYLAT